jgi:ATP-dependent DNA helicase PIF1
MIKPQVLSNDQQIIFDKITKYNKSIFFTGCGGTGKSFLVKNLIDYYSNLFESSKNLAVTASTGRAAFNIGGITFHSFCGIGLGKGDKNDILKRALGTKKLVSKWRNLKVLIIDEISMLSADYFDLTEELARKLRKNDKPFGGVQLVLTGDLLQLPPISDDSNRAKRIFQSQCWKKCITEYGCLVSVYRQSDKEFVNFLTCLRVGHLSKDVIDFANKLSVAKEYNSSTSAVNLYATRSRTDNFNNTELNKLNGKSVIYKSTDNYLSPLKSRNSDPLSTCPALEFIELKMDAQIMLIKNTTKDLVNGTVGKVIGFVRASKAHLTADPDLLEEQLPIVKFDLLDGRVITRIIERDRWSHIDQDGKEVCSRVQIPLILAWAVTIHKSQGQTIQRVKADLSDVFECGQVYTALSRAVSPEGLEVVNFSSNKVKVDNESLAFCLDNDLI